MACHDGMGKYDGFTISQEQYIPDLDQGLGSQGQVSQLIVPHGSILLMEATDPELC